MQDSDRYRNRVLGYLRSASTGTAGEYRSTLGGPETLYASAFAVMIHHYLNSLQDFSADEINAWGDYLLQFQDPETGLFRGPEITEGRLLSQAHDPEHLSLHSTCHILPALSLLGRKPRYPLRYMDDFLDRIFLRKWLEERDWTSAWLEGNNLLFIGQLLTYIHNELGDQRAKEPLDEFFDGLDQKVDPKTGLWGTDGNCRLDSAIFGAYHQLILYYYWNRPVASREKLIDSVLSIQHPDGGFFAHWGGGACHDVDSVDILVNMYKTTAYRKPAVETALRKAANAVKGRMTSEGGFVGARDQDFCHMGMEYTVAPAGKADMFSTWFAVHTLFLISELIDLPCTRGINYQFNDTASMGWHEKTRHDPQPFIWWDFPSVAFSSMLRESYFSFKKATFLFAPASKLVKLVKKK